MGLAFLALGSNSSSGSDFGMVISVAGKDFVVDIDVDDRYKMDGAMKNDDTMEGTDMISSSGANNRMVQSGFVIIDTAVCLSV